MSLINSILKVFVGDKSQKDVKATQPYINKIKALEPVLASLSHDELRAKTAEFKAKIKQARAKQDAEIEAKKAEAENTTDIDKREDIYNAIDALEKEAYQISEKVLTKFYRKPLLWLKKQHVVLKKTVALLLLPHQKTENFRLRNHTSL